MDLRQKRDIRRLGRQIIHHIFPMDAGIIHIGIFWCEICD